MDPHQADSATCSRPVHRVRRAATVLPGSLLLMSVGCAAPTADPVELPDSPIVTATPEVPCVVFTCRYKVFGSAACIDYYEQEGWSQELANENCISQFAAQNVNTSQQPSCISAGVSADGQLSEGACRTLDDASRPYYAFGVSEDQCSSILEGTWSAPPSSPCDTLGTRQPSRQP